MAIFVFPQSNVDFTNFFSPTLWSIWFSNYRTLFSQHPFTPGIGYTERQYTKVLSCYYQNFTKKYPHRPYCIIYKNFAYLVLYRVQKLIFLDEKLFNLVQLLFELFSSREHFFETILTKFWVCDRGTFLFGNLSTFFLFVSCSLGTFKLVYNADNW